MVKKYQKLHQDAEEEPNQIQEKGEDQSMSEEEVEFCKRDNQIFSRQTFIDIEQEKNGNAGQKSKKSKTRNYRCNECKPFIYLTTKNNLNRHEKAKHPEQWDTDMINATKKN